MQKNRTLKIIAIILGGILLCLCGLIANAVRTGSTTALKGTNAVPAVSSSTEEAKPTQTQSPSETPQPTNTQGPTITPIPSTTPIFASEGKTFPTAVSSLYDEILANKKTMTDLQYSEYLKSITGSRIHLRAKVNEVHTDGEIYLTGEGGGFFDSVYLKGVPKEIGIKLNKDQMIEFDATIRDFSDFIVFSVNLDEPVIYTIN